ncbi:component of SufBCD complex [Tabrizicola sp.]|uniref:component of SufBCD complex n=1 Tax=Tabrizicola sp. TaxID=2005166 RepID=UPI00286A64D7|nr:component of SufBCD complex [Tabrizicola sp.]
MDLIATVFEIIDMRSFSNLWYWIALAVLWSSTSHWVMGVPYDMLPRARREGGQAQADVEELARIYSSRLLAVVRAAGLWIVALGCFWMSVLGVLSFYYDVEFAQAVFFLVAPMTIVIWLSLRCARLIEAGENSGEALYRRLSIHRRFLQVLGMVSIFITSLFGMWQNLSNSILN